MREVHPYAMIPGYHTDAGTGAAQNESLPQDRQDDLGEIILTLIEQDVSDLQLSDEQVREVSQRLANPGAQLTFEVVLVGLDIRV